MILTLIIVYNIVKKTIYSILIIELLSSGSLFAQEENFKTSKVKGHPWAARTYRPEAFTDSNKGEQPFWGVEIGHRGNGKILPFIRRFDFQWADLSKDKDKKK